MTTSSFTNHRQHKQQKTDSMKTKQIHAQEVTTGVAVTFVGFRTPISGETDLNEGDTVFIASFNEDDGSYNVSLEKNGTAVETLFREEFKVEGEAATVKKAKKVKRAEPKTEAEENAGKATPIKDKAGKTIVMTQPAGALELTASVQHAIDEAGDLIKAVENIVVKASATDFTLGGLLAQIEKSAAFESIPDEFGQPKYGTGHKGFSLFVEEHLGMKYRKAKYLINIYTVCVERGITEKQLAGIGWSKIKEAIGALSEEDTDVEGIIEEAKGLTIAEFKAAMKQRVVDAGGTLHGNVKADQVTFNFRLFNDKAALLTEALALAKQAGDIQGDDIVANSQALDHIVAEWLSMQQ